MVRRRRRRSAFPARPGVTGTPASGRVAVAWDPAPSNGFAISNYQVSVFNGSGGSASGVTGATTRSVGSAATSFTFIGLTNGTAYKFKVAAVNTAGTGAQSSLSPAVTPLSTQLGPPGTPTVNGMQGAAALRWSEPSTVGATPITSYRVEKNTGSGWSSATPHEPQALATGSDHSCVLLSGGSVKCWGYNGSGDLGIGDAIDRGDNSNEMGDNLPAVNLGTGRSAVALDAGDDDSSALLDNGSVKCWGDNSHGELGYGDTADRGSGPNQMADNLPAIALGTGRTAVAIASGSFFNSALLDNGAVKCWGQNNHGQLGLGDTNDRGDNANEMGDNLPTVDLGTGRTATAITAGTDFTCALLDNARLKCWGRNADGQLGLGDTATRGDNANEMGDNLPTVDLGTGRTATAITAGGFHTCAVLDNGALKCWGANFGGQLGLGDTTKRGDNPGEMGDNLPAVDLGTGRTASAVSAGNDFTCARLDSGALKCWGDNGIGQLGLGDTTTRGDNPGEMGDSLPAINLGTGRTAIGVSAGLANGCARLDNGTVKCWGDNPDGELGLGDTTTRGDNPGEMGNNLPAIDLGSGRTAVAIAVGIGSHTCAVLGGGSVKCWGYNGEGELGLGDTTSARQRRRRDGRQPAGRQPGHRPHRDCCSRSAPSSAVRCSTTTP